MRNKKVMIALGLAATMLSANVLGVMAADLQETVNDNKITFEAGGTEPTDPVDPEEPDTDVDPDPDIEIPTGNTGSLRLDLVPAFDFGTQKIEVGQKNFYAELPVLGTYTDPDDKSTFVPGTEKVPYYVMVTDARGSGDGYTLKAKMTKQFTITDASSSNTGETLDGAKIKLNGVAADAKEGTKKPSTVSNGELVFDENNDKTINLATAEKANKEGMGVSVIRFGDTARYGGTLTADKSVEIEIPEKTQVFADEYKAVIEWNLVATP